jgi:hypothetical protein
MARAAAPMLSGLRVDTSTTQRRSNSAGIGKPNYSTGVSAAQHLSACKELQSLKVKGQRNHGLLDSSKKY